eukprot:9144617-Heterocapsa_arctica.AAC.1
MPRTLLALARMGAITMPTARRGPGAFASVVLHVAECVSLDAVAPTHYAPVCSRATCASLMPWCYTPAKCLSVGQCYATGWLIMVSKSAFRVFPATRPRLVRSSQTRTADFSAPWFCSH